MKLWGVRIVIKVLRKSPYRSYAKRGAEARNLRPM